MDREQIVKALECCASHSLADCDCCPIDKQKKDNCECGHFLAIQALALIRELTEENERLEDNLIKQSTENIMLLLDKQDIQADTVLQMQERLKECFYCDSENIRNTDAYVRDVVDQIAKEMLEEGT